MGIKNLTAWLKKNYGQVLHVDPVANFQNHTIAVDGSIFMCKFKATAEEHWLDSFLSLLCWLRKRNIHPIFVWDGPHPPEKNEEKERRKLLKLKQEEKIHALEKAVREYKETHQDGTFDGKELLEQIFAKESKKMPPLLIAPRGRPFDIKIVEDKLRRMKKNNFSIKPADYDRLKKMFRYSNGAPYTSTRGG